MVLRAGIELEGEANRRPERRDERMVKGRERRRAKTEGEMRLWGTQTQAREYGTKLGTGHGNLKNPVG